MALLTLSLPSSTPIPIIGEVVDVVGSVANLVSGGIFSQGQEDYPDEKTEGRGRGGTQVHVQVNPNITPIINFSPTINVGRGEEEEEINTNSQTTKELGDQITYTTEQLDYLFQELQGMKEQIQMLMGGTSEEEHHRRKRDTTWGELTGPGGGIVPTKNTYWGVVPIVIVSPAEVNGKSKSVSKYVDLEFPTVSLSTQQLDFLYEQYLHIMEEIRLLLTSNDTTSIPDYLWEEGPVHGPVKWALISVKQDEGEKEREEGAKRNRVRRSPKRGKPLEKQNPLEGVAPGALLLNMYGDTSLGHRLGMWMKDVRNSTKRKERKEEEEEKEEEAALKREEEAALKKKQLGKPDIPTMINLMFCKGNAPSKDLMIQMFCNGTPSTSSHGGRVKRSPKKTRKQKKQKNKGRVRGRGKGKKSKSKEMDKDSSDSSSRRSSSSSSSPSSSEDNTGSSSNIRGKTRTAHEYMRQYQLGKYAPNKNEPSTPLTAKSQQQQEETINLAPTRSTGAIPKRKQQQQQQQQQEQQHIESPALSPKTGLSGKKQEQQQQQQQHKETTNLAPTRFTGAIPKRTQQQQQQQQQQHPQHSESPAPSHKTGFSGEKLHQQEQQQHKETSNLGAPRFKHTESPDLSGELSQLSLASPPSSQPPHGAVSGVRRTRPQGSIVLDGPVRRTRPLGSMVIGSSRPPIAFQDAYQKSISKHASGDENDRLERKRVEEQLLDSFRGLHIDPNNRKRTAGEAKLDVRVSATTPRPILKGKRRPGPELPKND